jgi:RsiW-degrading membrane proteinase PrsW (M82 family)
MNYLFYIIFALAPSVIWLLFFLRKDVHPESNRMILIVFSFGILAAIPAALIEMGFLQILQDFIKSSILFLILSVFIGVALIEEVFKYLVVKGGVFTNPEFDEPIDVLLYMIIAALGFAVTENLLILSPISEPFQFQFWETLTISAFRFIGATFLHALCSGTLGYFLAISFLKTRERFKLLFFGFSLTILLHGLYNFSIMKIEGNLRFAIPIAILMTLAIFVSLGFQKLKKIKSICLIK